jgi:hypothetical protein
MKERGPCYDSSGTQSIVARLHQGDNDVVHHSEHDSDSLVRLGRWSRLSSGSTASLPIRFTLGIANGLIKYPQMIPNLCLSVFKMWATERKGQEETELSFFNTFPNLMFAECFLAQPIKIGRQPPRIRFESNADAEHGILKRGPQEETAKFALQEYVRNGNQYMEASICLGKGDE